MKRLARMARGGSQPKHMPDRPPSDPILTAQVSHPAYSCDMAGFLKCMCLLAVWGCIVFALVRLAVLVMEFQFSEIYGDVLLCLE